MRPGFAVLIAGAMVVLVASVPVSVQEARYGAYNEDWNGAGHLFEVDRSSGIPVLEHEGMPVEVSHGPLSGMDALDPDQDALLIVGPERGFDQQAIGEIRSFLEEGGRVLVADEVGSGQGLVEGLDVGVEITGVPYVTPVYDRSPRFPVALSTGAVAGLPGEVALDRPSVVTVPGAGEDVDAWGNARAEPVLVSPQPAWLDQDRDGQAGLGEPHGTFAAAAVTSVGEGELLVLGDADAFTGEMASANPGLAAALVAWAGQGERVLIVEEGHRAPADPVGLATVLSGGVPAWLSIVLVGLAVATFLWGAFRFRLTRVGSHARPSGDGGQASGAQARVLAELPVEQPPGAQGEDLD